MDNILVLGAGTYQIEGIKKLKEMGFSVIGFDGDVNAAGRPYCDTFYHIDIKQADTIIEVVERDTIKALAATCFATERPIKAIGEINNHFHWKGLSQELSELGRSKYEQRKVQEKAGLPTPKYAKVKTYDELLTCLANKSIHYPFILKPTDNSGSRGVCLIRNQEELGHNYANSLEESVFDHALVVEEFISGIEFTVETLVSNRHVYTLAISEKKKPINNYTVSSELFYNSPYVEQLRTQIETTIQTFVEHSIIDNTILHTEVIYSFSDHKVYMVETAVRGGGFHIFDKILPRITGIDVVKCSIEANLGKTITLDTIKRSPCIIRFMQGNKGTLNKIDINQDIIDSLSDVEYGFFVKVGDAIRELNTDGARLGYIITYGETWEDVFEKANKMDYAIKFEII